MQDKINNNYNELAKIHILKDHCIDDFIAKWRSLCEQEAAIRDGHQTASGPVLRIVVGGGR